MEKGDVPIVRLLVIYAPTRSLDFFHQYHGMSRHAGAVPGEAQAFLRGGLDIDLRGSDAAGRRDVLLHLRDKILELWPLRDDGGVDVLHEHRAGDDHGQQGDAATRQSEVIGARHVAWVSP